MTSRETKPALIVLEDGRSFRGRPPGAMTLKGADVVARLLTLALALLSAAAGASAAQSPCEAFARSVRETYNFKPSQLRDEADSDARSAAMDRFWERVKADRKNLLPCLRAALKDPQSDLWFRFDGSNLLVSLDPSPESKAEMVRHYAAVDLADVNLQFWVQSLARLGAEGFDVSEAGARWLAHTRPEYYLPQHGARRVDRFLGALFIYGSMDEAQATPALLKIAGTPGHAGREVALALLLMQATPEARRGLRDVNLAGMPAGEQAAFRAKLERPPLIAPREKPKTSREQFLKAFGDATRGEWATFLNLTAEVPDGERDVVAVLKAEDLPLVRKVRRLMIANANQHAAEYYVSFTQILDTLIQRPGALKEAAK
jgi:hypothetical protein